MRFGLSEETIARIQRVLADHPSVDQAVLFGSRAKGNFRLGSDIDLTLFGADLTPRQLDTIELALDELMLPYRIDLSNFKALEHAGLREHIERAGILFYQRRGSAGGPADELNVAPFPSLPPELTYMTSAYVVGHLTVKNPALWAEYRSKVPETLAPWGGELVFRGQQVAVLAGENPHPDIVVIRFPSVAAVNSWFSSSAYQALVPLREQAAEMVLLAYEA